MIRTAAVGLALVILVLLVPPVRAADTTLERKVGQMIMVGFRGTCISEAPLLADDIAAGRIGGVILFDYDVPRQVFERNIVSPDQVRRLVAGLQARADIPLFIAIDQEGGRVARLKERYGFPAAPSQASLGKLDDPGATEQAAALTALTLAAAGINVNFAPVVDVARNPGNPVIGALERSFSADPAVVIRHSGVIVDTFRRHGILSALKHFPGHGSSDADSHEGFVDVTELWSEEELLPFAWLIETQRADMVMTAHIFNGRLDPSWPATLSEATIDGLLRKQLGFDGVVVSDDLQMGAIRDSHDFEETVARAIGAGVDILLFANNSIYDEEVAGKATRVIGRLMDNGVIDAERIDRSYRRIMTLKSRL